MTQALSGIRIIDMTHNQAGPACTQILGFLGADVIKLEEPKGGDIARVNMRDQKNSDSLFFLILNANKRSLTLNLKTDAGKDLFRRVIAQSDVLVENFGPGALDRLGFGYAALAKINPRLIYATIKGFGRPMPRNGNQLGRNVPGTTYPCAPGGPNDYVFLYAQPQMWPAVAKVLGQPELTEDARFKTVEARWDNRAELNAIVEAWTRQRSKHEVMRLMGDAGVPCGACQDTGEVLADPHLKAREMIVDVDYPTRGTYQTVGCPIKLSDSPVAVSRPPLLGEHTDALLEALCGVEPDEAKRLRQEGVV